MMAMVPPALRLRPSAIHAHDLDTLPAGCAVRSILGVPLVYDAHEIYSHQFRPGFRSARWVRFWEGLERRLAPQADRVVTVGDQIARVLAERAGKDVVPILNCPPYEWPPARPPRGDTQRLRVLYHGLLTIDRGLEELVRAVRLVPGVELTLRGGGVLEARLRALVREEGVDDRVRFAPYVPMTELVRAAADADVGVLPFPAASENTRLCLPNKVFEYVMAGLAIVASDLPELRALVEARALGLIVPGQPTADALALALAELAKDPERLGRHQAASLRAAEERYRWDVEEAKLVALYEGLGIRPSVSPPGPGPR